VTSCLPDVPFSVTIFSLPTSTIYRYYFLEKAMVLPYIALVLGASALFVNAATSPTKAAAATTAPPAGQTPAPSAAPADGSSPLPLTQYTYAYSAIVCRPVSGGCWCSCLALDAFVARAGQPIRCGARTPVWVQHLQLHDCKSPTTLNFCRRRLNLLLGRPKFEMPNDVRQRYLRFDNKPAFFSQS
jgi:hypothetical protein